MSEKRYLFEKRYFVNSALYLCDNDLSNTLNIFECADLLNQLTEENEQLRTSVNYWQKKYKEGTETFQINENDRNWKGELKDE